MAGCADSNGRECSILDWRGPSTAHAGPAAHKYTEMSTCARERIYAFDISPLLPDIFVKPALTPADEFAKARGYKNVRFGHLYADRIPPIQHARARHLPTRRLSSPSADLPQRDQITVTRAGLGEAYEAKIKSFFDECVGSRGA